MIRKAYLKFQFRWAKTNQDLLPFCVYLYSIYTIYSRLLTSIVYYLYVSISIVLRLNDWSSFFYRFLQQWGRLLPPVHEDGCRDLLSTDPNICDTTCAKTLCPVTCGGCSKSHRKYFCTNYHVYRKWKDSIYYTDR